MTSTATTSTTSTAGAAGPAPPPLLDLQRLVVAVRRKRRFWLSFCLLGMLAGIALAIVMPPPPTAVTRLLIIHEQDQPTDGGTLMRTDIALLETTRIAEAALKSLDIDESPEEFLKTYDATGLTNNVLELTVHGADDADAVARAKALADAFIADHVQRIQVAVAADAQALVNQRDQAQAELTQVDATIATTVAEEDRDAPAELESLYARRAELASRISDLGRRAEEAGVGAPRVSASTQIVDAPRAVPTSLVRSAATNGVVGFILGLAIGLALAAVSTVVKDRPILRREIAANLGVSVIAQLSLPGRGPAELWRRPRRTRERRRIAAMLVRATRDDIQGMSLLELGAAKTTVALALDMAKAMAADGPVLLIDDLPRSQLLRKRAGTSGELKGDAGKRPIRIIDSAEHSVGAAGRYRPGGPRERQIGVGSARPGTAWTDLGKLGSETVLIVRSGHANTAWLHTVARQLADLQIPVIGVVLVNPDPRDRTDGTLWDGLHSAVRGRARRFSGPPADGLGSRPGAIVPPQATAAAPANGQNGEHPARRQPQPQGRRPAEGVEV